MSTTTLTRSAQGIHQNEVVFISAEDVSRDMLISYINVMRNHAALPPLKESIHLDMRARRSAQRIRKGKPELSITPDRSPYSVLKENASGWLHYVPTIRNRDRHIVVTESVSQSQEFLSCILRNRCTSIGMYVSDDYSTQYPILVLVFEMGDTDASTL